MTITGTASNVDTQPRAGSSEEKARLLGSADQKRLVFSVVAEQRVLAKRVAGPDLLGAGHSFSVF